MARWKGLSRLFSIVSSLIFIWSIFLLSIVLQVVIPKAILVAIGDYVPHSWKILSQQALQLQQLIVKQDFSLRCITVTASATKIFTSWIKEIVILVILSHWDGNYTETLSAALEKVGLSWVLYPLYIFQDLVRYVIKSSSFENQDDDFLNEESNSDDGGPPPLALDPQYIHEFVQDQQSLVSSSSPMIFDPVYGIIPEEIQQLWAQQTQKRDLIRQHIVEKRRQQPLPPVRNYETTHSNVSSDLQPSRDNNRVKPCVLAAPQPKMNKLNHPTVLCKVPETDNEEEEDIDNGDVMVVNQSENHLGGSLSPAPGGAPLWDE